MKIFKGYKTRLRPNNKQRTFFIRCAGTARFVYNWALADRKRLYAETGKGGNLYEQKRRFNALKDVEFPWIRATPYKVTEAAFVDLDAAYQNFFRRIKAGDKPGFPRFKSKHRSPMCFRMRDHIHIEPRRIKLPKIGWVRLAESGYLPSEDTVKLLSVTISERAGHWFVCAQVEEEVLDPIPGDGPPLGVDMGLSNLAVCSDGMVFENPQALVAGERKLKRIQRELSRRKKGGKNRAKSQQKLARQHERIAAIRAHTQHQVSYYVTAKTKPRTVVVEDLNVKGMAQNRSLAHSVHDAGMSEVPRQIKYKAVWNGVEVVKANRWYASSQLCSGCGAIVRKSLADRIHACPHCGLVLGRDYNAARNLASLAVSP